MTANRFNFRAYIKPYNKIYKVQSLENDGTFMAVKCFEEDGKTILKRNDNRTYLPLFTEGEFVLMQSTGLVDKNGKEIFEGDLIQGEYEEKQFIFEVIWKKTSFCLRTGITTMSFANIENIEVIGNIYENPELLKS